MSVSHFRRTALALPGAVEGAHQRTADFRVGKRVFATLGYPGTGRLGQAGLHQCAAGKGRCDDAEERADDGLAEHRREITAKAARKKEGLKAGE
jgi:hypothetical protein